MNELQERLLLLLKELDTICKKHNITYYIDGGSAIGAIRHNGFIPWDDDIDIAMTRENYDKFNKIIDSELPEGRVYESFERNKKYTMLYGRYCDTTSTSILKSSMIDVFKSGVFIDIFILDPYPNEEKKRKKYMRLLSAYAEYVNPYYYTTITHDNYFDIFKLRVLGFFLGRMGLYKYINRKLFSFKEEDCKDYCFRFDLFKFIYPKEYFKEPRIMKFEDMDAPVPTMIEDYLKVHYGNTWMYIPKPDNQEVHEVVTNVGVPYETFKNDYMPFVRKDIIKSYKTNHILKLKNVKAENKFRLNEAILLKTKYEYKSNKILKDYDVEKIYLSQKYDKLDEIFNEFYTGQLDKLVYSNKLVVDIGENVYYAILNLVEQGYYYKAKKIIKLYPNKYKDLEEQINIIEKLNEYYYKYDEENYFNIIDECYESNSRVIDFIEGRVKYLILNNKLDEASKLIEKSLKLYKNDAFLLKYKADILYKNSKTKKDAVKLYNDIISKTNNGLLILEIKNIIGGNNNGQESK